MFHDRARRARAHVARLSRLFPSPDERIGITFFVAGVLIVLAQSAFAYDFEIGDIEIVQPWARATPPGAAVGGGYLVINNHGATADRLLSAAAEVSDRAELHEMAVKNGIMTMRPVKGGLEIPAGGSVALAPNSLHLMLIDLKAPLKKGAEFKGTLTFEKAGTVEVQFAVQGIGAAAPGPDADATGQMNMGQMSMGQ